MKRLLIACMAALVASCSESTGPRNPASFTGLRVIVRPSAQDTVDALPSQALVVELRDSAGTVLPGLVVRFDPAIATCHAPFDCQYPSMRVRSVESAAFASLIADTTDAQGRASALVQFGTISGAASIAVTVPVLGLAETVGFTVLPGALSRVMAEPSDTTLMVGGAPFAPRLFVSDRHLNPRTDPLSYSVSGPLTVAPASAGVLSGDVPGIGVAYVAHGDVRDSIGITVVPPGVIAGHRAWSSPTVLVVNTDGSDLRALATLSFSQGDGRPSWAADGASLVFRSDPIGGGSLFRSDLSGALQPFSTPGVSNAAWPSFSPDGSWVYFSGTDVGVKHLWRIRSDGTQLERVSDATALVDEVQPSVSHNGERVVFVRGSSQIMVRHMGSGTVTPLAQGSHPRFSPTQDRIAYITAEAIGAVAVINGDGTNPRIIKGEFEYAQGLDWSPDGTWLVLSRFGTPILVEVETGLTLPLRWGIGLLYPTWRP